MEVPLLGEGVRVNWPNGTIWALTIGFSRSSSTALIDTDELLENVVHAEVISRRNIGGKADI